MVFCLKGLLKNVNLLFTLIYKLCSNCSIAQDLSSFLERILTLGFTCGR